MVTPKLVIGRAYPAAMDSGRILRIRARVPGRIVGFRLGNGYRNVAGELHADAWSPSRSLRWSCQQPARDRMAKMARPRDRGRSSATGVCQRRATVTNGEL